TRPCPTRACLRRAPSMVKCARRRAIVATAYRAWVVTASSSSISSRAFDLSSLFDTKRKGGYVMKGNQIVCAVVLLGTGALGLGCVAHAQATGSAEADAPVVFVEPPTLVEVDANVWVVRDYDAAVYYVDGFYWVYRNDTWWRAQAYDQGWARVDVNVVPVAIAHRDHHAY